MKMRIAVVAIPGAAKRKDGVGEGLPAGRAVHQGGLLELGGKLTEEAGEQPDGQRPFRGSPQDP